jgi:hypothetical protein
MRITSWTPATIAFFGALACAVACGDDDDDTSDGTNGGSASAGKGGSAAGKGGSSGSAGKGGTSVAEGGAGGAAAMESQLCKDLGGPENIDAVVRGDGKASAQDPFNAYKFGQDRHASVLLNVATDPCIGMQFAHLLGPGKAADLEHLAQCLSIFVQSAAGCSVAYDGAEDSSGKVCKDMKSAHEGLGITEEDYTALVMDAAKSLNAAGVASGSPQFEAVAGALTSDELKADVITTEAEGYSQPGAMCETAAGGAGGAGTGGAGGAQ